MRRAFPMVVVLLAAGNVTSSRTDMTGDMVDMWQLAESSGSATGAHGGILLAQSGGATGTGTCGGRTARDFESSNTQYLSANDSPELSLGSDTPFTIAARVQFESLTQPQVIAARDSGAGLREFELFADPAGGFGLRIWSVESYDDWVFNNTVALTTGVCYTVVAWHDPVANQIAVSVNNGPPVTKSWNLGTRDTAAEFWIGSGFAGYFDGLIGSVVYWKRMISNAERTEYYNGGSGVSYDDINGGAGTPLENLPLLQRAHITGNYLGGFRMPTAPSGGHDWDFAQRGGISFDSATGHLYVSDGSVCTVNVPALVNSSDPAAMNQASWQQSCVDPGEGQIHGDMNFIQNGYQLGGLLRMPGDYIYLAAYAYYDGDGQIEQSHFRRSATLSTNGYNGLQKVGNFDNAAGWLSLYMARVPAEWQAALGGVAVTGGCCIPIVARTSNGMSLASFNPADIYTAAEPIAANMLLGYPDDHQTLGPWGAQSERYNGATQARAVVLINNTRTLLFVGIQGTGEFCYGDGGAGPPTTDCFDPQNEYAGTHAYPYRLQMWAYDLMDLAAVKTGADDMWEPVPYDYWSFTLPTTVENAVLVFGADYDPVTKRLYLIQSRGHGYQNMYPIIHAFEVDDTP